MRTNIVITEAEVMIKMAEEDITVSIEYAVNGAGLLESMGRMSHIPALLLRVKDPRDAYINSESWRSLMVFYAHHLMNVESVQVRALEFLRSIYTLPGSSDVAVKAFIGQRIPIEDNIRYKEVLELYPLANSFIRDSWSS